jgi:hypothetical protein
MSVLQFFERGPNPCAGGTDQHPEKRKDYATGRAYGRTLTGRKFSIKVRRRAQIQMINKYAFE